MLYHLLIAVMGILLPLAAWVVVQAAWRRMFPSMAGDGDVLAARRGCGPCALAEDCAQAVDDASCKRLTHAPLAKADPHATR